MARPSTPVRFQAPMLPDLDAVGSYFRLSEQARWFANGGPCATLLEDRLSRRLGPTASVVLVASATSGLLVALRAVFGSPRAERRLVIAPSFTFVASADAIAWAGFEPLFVDVDPDGWHLSPTAVAAALACHPGRVAGILACSTFGTPPSTAARTALDETARAFDVPVVYDSAAAFGGRDDAGRESGAAGDVEVYSFHATKPFAIGEGGAVVTHQAEQAGLLRTLSNFGFGPDRRAAAIGINAKMSELHAATGLAVLDSFDEILAARRTRAAMLRTALEPAGWMFQAGAAGSTTQFVPALAPTASARHRLLRRAEADQIELRTYFDVPLHRTAAFDAAPRHGALSVTEALSHRVVSLPMANDLTEQDLERLIDCCLALR